MSCTRPAEWTHMHTSIRDSLHSQRPMTVYCNIYYLLYGDWWIVNIRAHLEMSSWIASRVSKMLFFDFVSVVWGHFQYLASDGWRRFKAERSAGGFFATPLEGLVVGQYKACFALDWWPQGETMTSWWAQANCCLLEPVSVSRSTVNNHKDLQIDHRTGKIRRIFTG